MFNIKKIVDEEGDITYTDAQGNEFDTLQEAVENLFEKDEVMILTLVHAQNILESMVTHYFWERYKADPDWRMTEEGGDCEWYHTPGIRSIDIEEDNVEINCSAAACGRGCCGSDYRTYRFPTSYLWFDQTEILADMKAKAEVKARVEEARRQKAEEERKRQMEAQDRKRLAELKAKYPEEVA